MISYAQNAEDVVLARAFADRSDGFWVDVGAGHPVLDSVTKHFSDRGWRGVNVEPLQDMFQRLLSARPRDVNLPVALGRAPGEAVLYAGPPENRGSSTLDASLAETYRARGEQFLQTTVPMTTLREVCADHCPATFQFLKIDVEGAEREVLEGGDLAAWRPEVIVVEATRPNSTELASDTWEDIVIDAGYERVLFDGLNNFYVEEGAAELSARVGYPPCVLDGYVTYGEWNASRDLARLRDSNQALQRSIEEMSGYAAAVEARAERAEEYAQSLQRARDES